MNQIDPSTRYPPINIYPPSTQSPARLPAHLLIHMPACLLSLTAYSKGLLNSWH